MARRKHTQKRIDYITNWNKENQTQVRIVFRNKDDEDVINYIKGIFAKSAYMKELIRADMKSKGIEVKEPSLKN